MGVISNIVRETEELPVITREQLSVIQSFKPAIRIIDIRKPIEDLWEFYCDRYNDFGGYCYIWMSVDGRIVGTAYEEMRPVPLSGGGREKRKYGIGVKRVDWASRWGMSREAEIIESEYGLMGLGEDIYTQMQDWCVDQVRNRVYGDRADYYGRVWPDNVLERCAICGQPYDPTGPGCNHVRLNAEEVAHFKGEIEELSAYQQAIEREHQR